MIANHDHYGVDVRYSIRSDPNPESNQNKSGDLRANQILEQQLTSAGDFASFAPPSQQDDNPRASQEAPLAGITTTSVALARRSAGMELAKSDRISQERQPE